MASTIFDEPAVETAPEAGVGNPAPAETPASAPVETPAPDTSTQETIIPETVPVEPAKPAEAEPAKEEAKAETPAETPEEEYVKASDYDALKKQLDEALGNKAAPAEEAKADDAAPAKPAEKKPVVIDPELVVAPEEIEDDFLVALGIDPADESAKDYRTAIAKREGSLLTRAADLGEARATARFQGMMSEMIAAQVAVHYNAQGVAAKIIGETPELGAKENFPKTVKAIQEAITEAKSDMNTDQIAQDARRRYEAAAGIVQRFKSQGGKIVRPASTQPGTSPQQAVGTIPPAPKAPQQRNGPDPRKSTIFD